ncbi:hypothetical protein HRbin22_02091 [Candidatus Thermoflexus japonica]|uniref:SAF domain-containing protein n=1 Tax=Candidatus Thermoflexus japonica TaxID=2035417 RepID=A0A2H5Y8S7_9CHLR|nr:hypothetical protein HRbin22_02091 [Candidatus Thermoflexus japonica]
MLRVRQVLPLLIGLAMSAVVAIAARVFITTGVPDQTAIAVAAVPLYPGDLLTEDRVRTVSAYDAPAVRGMIREADLPRYTGGTVLMFIPAGAAIPRTAILPSGQFTAAARLSSVMVEGEQLLPVQDTDRIQAPPFSMLRPGDCLDVVAFFGTPTGGSSPATSLVESEGATPQTPVLEITGTTNLTLPVRPMAKWLARGVVRSVLGLPIPSGGEGASAVRTSSASAGAPQLLLGVPQSALEGIIYALETAERVYFIVTPPCVRAEIPPSTGFAERDLEQWVRAGRQAAGAPTFFLPSGSEPPARR